MEVPSLSDLLTDSNSDESSNEDVSQECKGSDAVDGYKFKESTSDTECNDLKSRNLVLDLRNLIDSQNEEEKYEKLSEVIEEPEEIYESTIIPDDKLTSSESKETKEENSPIKERISLLYNVILSLRDELKREISLWRKERDEFQFLQEKNDLLALDEATAAARAAAEAYAAESPLSDDLDGLRYNCCEILDVNPEQTLSELTILEYEKKLAKYQDALALAQAEKRYNMRRQLAANTYRQKLIEVERLCDEELEKIKKSAISLQPLKQMVSQWYMSDRCAGDATTEEKSIPTNLSLRQNYSRSNFSGVPRIGNKIDAEVNMTPEIFVAKFNNFDDNDFLSKGTNFKVDDDMIRHNNDASGGNTPLSLKWESSNYTLPTLP